MCWRTDKHAQQLADVNDKHARQLADANDKHATQLADAEKKHTELLEMLDLANHNLQHLKRHQEDGTKLSSLHAENMNSHIDCL